MLMNSHTRDARIQFEPNGHIYRVDGMTGYQSVTGLIKTFFKPFDAEKILTRLVAKGAGKREAIAKSWQDKREFGSTVHNLIENYLLTGKWPEEMTPDLIIVRDQFLDFWTNLNRTRPIKAYRPEMRIFDEDAALAGSIDLLVEFEDGVIDLFDWKCIEKLCKDDFGSRGKVPFELYPDNNFSHYTLQLNFYKFILEKKYDMIVDRIHLVQFHPNMDTWKMTTCVNIPDEVDVAMPVSLLSRQTARWVFDDKPFLEQKRLNNST